MDNNPSQLELLPNETFMDIFQYFDIKELFQIFDNLNFRFNTLIRSLNNLMFKLYANDYIQTYNFISYINILTIYCPMYVNFKYFQNIRHLNLIQLTDDFLQQLNILNLPYLEDLSIKKLYHGSAYILYGKIFSNTFPRLKSCFISHNSAIETNVEFTYLPVLWNLQIGIINLRTYESILSVCPNLYFFKFRLKSSETSVNVKPHLNLKRMIIKSEDYPQSKNDYCINICLSLVPNLERLSIHQDFFQGNISYYLKHDWYASIIARYLSLFCQFNHHLSVWYFTGLDRQIINIVDEMKRNFRNAHNKQYRSKFHFNLTY